MTLENIISKIDSATGRLIVESMKNPVIKEAHEMLIDVSNELGDMYYLEDLNFVGMDVIKEAKEVLNANDAKITNGMTDSEKKGYLHGVKNALSVLNSIFNDEDIVVHIAGLENQEEFDVKELYEKLIDDNYDDYD